MLFVALALRSMPSGGRPPILKPLNPHHGGVVPAVFKLGEEKWSCRFFTGGGEVSPQQRVGRDPSRHGNFVKAEAVGGKQGLFYENVAHFFAHTGREVLS